MAKRERSEVPEDLTLEEKKRLVVWMRLRQAEYGEFDWIEGPREMRREIDACLSWHGQKGNTRGYSDWYRVAQRWLLNAQRFREVDRQRGKRETFVDLERIPRLRVIAGGAGGP